MPSLNRFAAANNLGQPTKGFPANWLVGAPFLLDLTFANGTATDFDLTTQDAWYGDAGVRAQFAPANGSSSKMQAMVQIDAVGIALVDADVIAIGAGTVDGLFKARPYLEMSTGGVTKAVDLTGAIGSFFDQWSPEAADTLMYLRLPTPRMVALQDIARLQLDSDTLKLKTVNDAALGAAFAESFRLMIRGALIPKADAVNFGSYIGGTSCGQSIGAIDGDGQGWPEVAQQNALAMAPSIVRPFGA